MDLDVPEGTAGTGYRERGRQLSLARAFPLAAGEVGEGFVKGFPPFIIA